MKRDAADSAAPQDGFCSQCGTAQGGNVRFCPGCGWEHHVVPGRKTRFAPDDSRFPPRIQRAFRWFDQEGFSLSASWNFWALLFGVFWYAKAGLWGSVFRLHGALLVAWLFLAGTGNSLEYMQDFEYRVIYWIVSLYWAIFANWDLYKKARGITPSQKKAKAVRERMSPS